MAAMTFDTLKYARRLREVGVPEVQADTQAELMAEAFGFYIDNLATKDDLRHLEARLEAKMDRRFAVQNVMLGIIMVSVVVPRLQEWLS